MNLGVGMISKENAGKTADFLLTKPVRRTGVMTAKMAAALTSILATNAVFTLASYAAVASVNEPFSTSALLLMALTMLLVQLFFFALGALFSVIIPKIKSVVAVSLPTVFAFYIIGAIGDVLENVEVRWASPFRYYDYIYIIKNTSYETKYVLFSSIFVIAAIVASYVVFVKKDVHSAV
jgi:ABC-2 type transport system permease protein